MTGSASYEERHARAAETFTRFVPDVDPERVAASMSRRLGVLGGFAFDTVGEMWARPALSRRDRSLFIVSILAAQARDEELELHTQIAIRNGVTRTEIEELLPHVAAYAGFPAAMASSRVIDAALRTVEGVERLEGRTAAPGKSDAERDRDGTDVLRTLTAGRAAADPADALAGIEAALGGVGTMAMRWAFGEIWCRPGLSRRDRSLAVIAILTSLGATEELAFHVPGGLNHGLTRDEIEEVMTHLTLYVGFPRAVQGMRAARAAFAKIDGRG
jgi:4-carboxymuconolactone decarboxylase